jgi:putative membrane protein
MNPINSGTMTPDGHTLADRLAIERTRRAHERTLLAYIRTGLVIVAAGIGVAEYFANPPAPTVGVLVILAGIGTLVIGVWRFVNAKRALDEAATNGRGLET